MIGSRAAGTLEQEMYFLTARTLFLVLLLASLCTGEGRLRGLLRLSGPAQTERPCVRFHVGERRKLYVIASASARCNRSSRGE